MADSHDHIIPKRVLTPKFIDAMKVVAIVLPWLCTTVFPALWLDGFVLSAGRCAFFLFVMVPFGNIAMLGCLACCHGLMLPAVVVMAFTGMVAPIALSLLFAIFWRQWQFILVWVGYIMLVAWDTLIAMFLALLIIKG